MTRTSWIRWGVRVAWLASVVVGYRSIVDVGSQGSAGYIVHMIVMFAIYAAGDLALERWGPRPAQSADSD